MASAVSMRAAPAPLAGLALEKEAAAAPTVRLARGALRLPKARVGLDAASQRASAVVTRAQATEQPLEASTEAGAAAAEGTKLYVGNLPWNVDSATLAEIFQDAGVVEEVEVICDRDTGRSRGFAFVVMSTPEDARAALERFDGAALGGRTLRVNFPTPVGQRRTREARLPRQGRTGATPREENPNKLYVGNLSWGVDDLALQELFSDFGKVMEARVVMDRETGRSRGFGFVTLSNQDEVSSAVSNLDGAEYDGRQIRVNLASQKPRA